MMSACVRRLAASSPARSRSLSCPDLLSTPPHPATVGPVRRLNLMLLNPRAPKIRHLNASHSLLIEMEKHVRKVQELEHKVHELEMQLQLRELVKTHTVINQAWDSSKAAAATQQKEAVSQREQEQFQLRLQEARRKAELLSCKRAEEEANILRSWHQKKLRLAIDKLQQIPETESNVKLLPEPKTDSENTSLMINLDALVEIVHAPEQSAGSELSLLATERSNLTKLLEDIREKEVQAHAAVQDCKTVLFNVNSARIKLNANLKMSGNLLDKMQGIETRRKNQNMFVYGPNPIFSSARDNELNYSINNQFVIEMLKELDISFLVAEKNLLAAKECRKRYKENKMQIEESLQLLNETIDMQLQAVEIQEESVIQTEAGSTLESDSSVVVVSANSPEELGPAPAPFSGQA